MVVLGVLSQTEIAVPVLLAVVARVGIGIGVIVFRSPVYTETHYIVAETVGKPSGFRTCIGVIAAKVGELFICLRGLLDGVT